MKKAFKTKQKAFFIIFIGLSLKYIKQIFLEDKNFSKNYVVQQIHCSQIFDTMKIQGRPTTRGEGGEASPALF